MVGHHPELTDIIDQQRRFFATGKTKDIDFRIQQLERLKDAIQLYQPQIVDAVRYDLGRPEFEAYFEVTTVTDINYAIKNLRKWAKPRRVSAGIEQFPSVAQIVPEPLGVVLIIGPWNYPFQLMMLPLIGAIAAGNCAILKPSELAVKTSEVVTDLINKTFDKSYITSIEGGVETSQALLAEKFDHIFFTGGTAVGKIVMQAAAKNLTPVTLELGGKSPCIVDQDINLETTARRIIWGKFINAGQTCVAPDYLLVDRGIKAELLTAIRATIKEFFGDDPAKSPDYSRIISQKHLQKLAQFIDKNKVIMGGEINQEDRYIAPTIMDGVNWDDPIMQEEIFGPILPILEYNDLGEAIAQINARPKPLALYIFTKDKAKQERILQSTSSGGVGINETIMQVAPSSLPFGGVGDSGIGSYHGKFSFDTFSHYKSILKKGLWFDLKWRYAPYQGKLDLIKKIIGVK